MSEPRSVSIPRGAQGRPRPAAVAGTFYPADAGRLAQLVNTLLGDAAGEPRPPKLSPDSVLGVLVPHAGLVYSGSIAALGWLLIGEMVPSTIVLAGTDHQAAAAGVGVWTGGPWQTPLGDVPIDRDLALEIAALGPPFAPDDDAHRTEHSLEVQLPLLLGACPGAQIVPLAVSPRLTDHDPAGARLGALLAQRRAAGERVILVASSDFAHYPPAQVCEEVDDSLIAPLLDMDGESLDEMEEEIVRSRRPGLICGMCGIDPVRFSISALDEMGATAGMLLGKATSADAGGDPHRTVGYVAAAFA
jgi:MEMO1 family protein